jgi:L-asparaginase
MVFMTTGGTIDKMPVFLPDGSFDNDSKVFGETYLPEMLKKANFLGKYSLLSLFAVDSLEMTDEHRQEIAEAMLESAEEQVIITHGTDTMPETARFLSRDRQLIAHRTIVLTGAMLPYSVGEPSDAMFNLGSALAFAQTLPHGVYVAMDGQSFDADNVRKDVEAGVFKTIR